METISLEADRYCLDYPMSSSLSAESTPLGSRAVLSLSVFAAMGLGNMAASIVFLVLVEAFQSSVESNIHYAEWVWRLFLGLGMIPAAITLYARWTMPETSPYEKCLFPSYQDTLVREKIMKLIFLDVSKDTSVKEVAKRGLKEQSRDFFVYFREWRHTKVLFATSASWFLL